MSDIDDPVDRRDKEIRVHLALGTLDVNKFSGKDLLAVKCVDTMLAIKPIWIEKRRNDYVGKKGWEHIMLGRSLNFFGMPRALRNEEILRQEEI